ncbi:MAG TPA: NAD(P)-dependent oxidoreductase [Desulfuromonadales bacterium]|nr:NAD(P)-dependent oxidoreductase [Desulfuromonadales bacterium]
MQIGFIGFGHLGTAIAGRLQERGHRLVAWNRTSAKVKTLSLEPADSPRVVGEAAEVVFLCLFDSRAVQNVLTGDQGLLAGKVAGKVIVDLTTNHFEDVRTFHELCRQAGASYLEAPVLGSVTPASKGALTVLVSGTEEAYTAVRPLLEEIGEHLFHLPEPATATKMKLVNNLVLGSFMAVLAEAVAFAEKLGMAKEQVLDILAAGGGKSLVLSAKQQKLLAGEFSTHFSNALIHKDLHCLQDLAYQEKLPLFSAALPKELYAQTFMEGIDQEDFSAIYKLFKK